MGSPLFGLATNPVIATQQWTRYLQEMSALTAPLVGSTARPDPPRSLIAQPGTQSALITWNSPQNTVGIAGYNVYKDNEGNRIDSVTSDKRQYTITLPASTPTGVYISSFNNLGVESIKVQIIATANSDQVVTTGGTNGSQPSPPPNYQNEPTGGGNINGGQQAQ
jgi:hypothetical protein